MPFNARHHIANVRHEYSNTTASGSSGSSTVSGILRKVGGSSGGTSNSLTVANAAEVRHVDLLVFGYACKVFRDDDKARDIDQGKHLIPWMGDNNLKIDRLCLGRHSHTISKDNNTTYPSQ